MDQSSSSFDFLVLNWGFYVFCLRILVVLVSRSILLPFRLAGSALETWSCLMKVLTMIWFRLSIWEFCMSKSYVLWIYGSSSWTLSLGMSFFWGPNCYLCYMSRNILSRFCIASSPSMRAKKLLRDYSLISGMSLELLPLGVSSPLRFVLLS